MVAIWLTVFFDLMSFGLVIPDVQLRAENLGAKGAMVGLVIAIYSISQFLFSPYLGSLSDRHGRRVVLLFTSIFSVLAAFAYSFSHSIWIMLGARFLLGLSGASLGVAYAYISDVTAPENRAAAMGKIGMAFGVGFMIGPPLGAYLVTAGGGQPFLLGVVSAAFAFVNLLFVYFFLPHIPPKKRESAGGLLGEMKAVGQALRTPGLSVLLLMFFVANFAFSNLESTYFRLAKDVYAINQQQTSFVLVYVGLVAAVFQGGMIPRLVAGFGEVKLLRVAYLLQGPALALVPFTPIWIPLLIGALFLGVGNGMAQPSLSSLLSRNAPVTLVGGIFGVQSALGAIARIFGPVLGNQLYEVRPWVPYALAGALMLAPLALAQTIPDPTSGPGSAGEPAAEPLV
ncbi:MAG: MFS transporter [Fimbriimonadaceae bacterium]|nr:MFS transporter [Fimbriimonadaceae bacterium]QYK56819.1 MAG: MFS transporter [Fimbriimonadaceae bacterium]